MRSEDSASLIGKRADVLDAGVDWLTATSPRMGEKHEQVLSSWYELFRLHREAYGIVNDASFLGYQGISCEGFFVGTRYDGAMIRISGKTARDKWLQVWLDGCSITRLDVQVTVSWEGRGFHPARLAAMHAETANQELPSNRKRNVEERKDNRDGYTTYIGSRQSPSFSRCYHKSAESPDAYGEGAWRYEVQYNKDLAGKVHQALTRHDDAVQEACIALVWDWYERRGVIPVFRRSATVVPVSRETMELTALDRKLAWLYNQVRPTVAELIAQGYQKEVLVALLGVDLGGLVEGLVTNAITADKSEGSTIGMGLPYGDPDTL